MKNHTNKSVTGGGGKSPGIQVTAKYARSILAKHLAEISGVGEWAVRTECSACWLGRCIQKHYGMMAKEMLRDERYKRICTVIRNDPTLRADQVADLVNRTWNGKHLCDFLRRNYKTNFTELKHNLLVARDETGEKFKSNGMSLQNADSVYKSRTTWT